MSAALWFAAGALTGALLTGVAMAIALGGLLETLGEMIGVAAEHASKGGRK